MSPISSMAIAAEAISKAVPKALAVGLGGRALLRQVCADFAIAVADVTKN